MKLSLTLAAVLLLSSSAVAQTIDRSWSVDPVGLAFVGGLHYDCGTDRVWVADETNNFITAYDGSGTLIVQYPSPALGSNLPIGVGVDPNTGMLWIGDEGEIVYEMDPVTGLATGTSWTTIPAITDVSGVSVDPTTGNIYVSQDSGIQVVVEFDQAGTVLNTIDVSAISGDPDGLAFNTATGTYYLGDDTGDFIYEVDGTGALINSWDMSLLGISPEGLGVDLELGEMYIGDGFITRSVYVVTGIVTPVPGSCGGPPGFNISVSGTCPGSMNVDASNATPNGQVAFVYAFGQGNFVVPNGQPCAGTPMGLSGAGITLAAVVVADANGDATLNGNAPASACGVISVQALDLTTCNTSNVVDI